MKNELLDDLREFDNQPTGKINKWLLWSLYLQMVIVIGATFFAWVDIESIVHTWWASSIGIPLAFFAYKQKVKPILYLGISTPLIASFSFILIWVLGWGPADARIPIPMIMTCYTVVTAIFTYKEYEHNQRF